MKHWLLVLALMLPATAPVAEVPPFPAGEAWDNLVTQCEMGPRNPGSRGHETCRRWLVERFKSWGYRVEQHWISLPDPYSEGELELVNLRAWLPGRKGPFTALGAHWDTRPRADKDPDKERRSEPIIGASDGASGVAILLTLARLCAADPPEKPVEFILFDGEDYGLEGRPQDYLLGSRQFVRDHPGFRPDLLILLDIVGGSTLQLPQERYSLDRAGDQLNALYDLAAELDLPAFKKRPGRYVYDDHLPFLEAGIPAVDLVDLDYPQWHTTGDIPEACAESSLGQVGTLLVHYLYK